jgi:hypothetical protein
MSANHLYGSEYYFSQSIQQQTDTALKISLLAFRLLTEVTSREYGAGTAASVV